MENPLKRRDGARPAAPRDVDLRTADGPADHASDRPSQLGNFFDWLPNQDRDTSAAPSASHSRSRFS